MKKLILLSYIVFISLTSYAQNQSNTVMIKSIETYGSFTKLKRNLQIVDEHGIVTTIELEKHNTEGIPKNMLTIKTELDKYLNRGFEIVSSNAVSFGENGVFTIEHSYVLEKIKKNGTE